MQNEEAEIQQKTCWLINYIWYKICKFRELGSHHLCYLYWQNKESVMEKVCFMCCVYESEALLQLDTQSSDKRQH